MDLIHPVAIEDIENVPGEQNLFDFEQRSKNNF